MEQTKNWELYGSVEVQKNRFPIFDGIGDRVAIRGSELREPRMGNFTVTGETVDILDRDLGKMPVILATTKC